MDKGRKGDLSSMLAVVSNSIIEGARGLGYVESAVCRSDHEEGEGGGKLDIELAHRALHLSSTLLELLNAVIVSAILGLRAEDMGVPDEELRKGIGHIEALVERFAPELVGASAAESAEGREAVESMLRKLLEKSGVAE